ncbi:MAG TPA: Crp/Fnr family transcriptional regulator [Acidimicrobiia bacterium]|nr:Crp/Fnr family transcriptional regulator [Acidimicrobiia bacterium]
MTSTADMQHHAWLARSFGRTDYLLLSPDDLAALASVGRYVEKYPGTHLFRQGAASTSAYVIHRGAVELYRGDRTRIVTRVGEGAVLGDIAMFKGDPYLSSARAVGAVTALRLDRDRLLPLLVERPIIALRWLVAGLDQLERTQRRVLRLMHRTVREQVADLLLDEADERGEIRLSQGAIATLLGTSRQSVNEALAELKDAGAVETGYRLVRVTDRGRASAAAARS